MHESELFRMAPRVDRHTRWVLQLSGSRGSAAQANLGLAYVGGDVCHKIWLWRRKWYRKAAEHGDANGQFNLGLMYGRGEGVQRRSRSHCNVRFSGCPFVPKKRKLPDAEVPAVPLNKIN